MRSGSSPKRAPIAWRSSRRRRPGSGACSAAARVAAATRRWRPERALVGRQLDDAVDAGQLGLARRHRARSSMIGGRGRGSTRASLLQRDGVGAQHDRRAQHVVGQRGQPGIVVRHEAGHVHQHLRHRPPGSRRSTVSPASNPAAASACASRARLMSSATSSPSSERSAPLGSGGAAHDHSACTCGAPSGRGAQNGSRATTWMRGSSLCSSAVHQAAAGGLVLGRHRQHGGGGAPGADLADRLRRRAVDAQRRQRAEMLPRGGRCRRLPGSGSHTASTARPASPSCRRSAPARRAPG